MKNQIAATIQRSLNLFLLAACWAGTGELSGGTPKTPAAGGDIFRSFEFRAVSADPAANGETDFKGETATLSTAERIAFLNAYAKVASAWFGDPQLDQLAVKPGEAQERLAQLKPQPTTSIRQTIFLDDGWKQMAWPADPKTNQANPWRPPGGEKRMEGALLLPAGSHELFQLEQSSGWRFELRWEVCGSEPRQRFYHYLDQRELPQPAKATGNIWHTYRLHMDLAESSGYFSEDGKPFVKFRLEERAKAFGVHSEKPFRIRNLVFIDYRPRKNDKQPYVPVILVDESFRSPAPTNDWNLPAGEDSHWLPASLPCVHGGFREAEEDLYLRREVNLPPVRRAWLEVEALDPGGEIYVNGQRAGSVTNRLPVHLEITRLIQTGPNLIAIKVNHNWIDDPSLHTPADQACGWFAGRATLQLLREEVAIRELLVNTASLANDKNARQVHRVQIDNAGDQAFDGTLEIRYQPWFPKTSAPTAAERIRIQVPAHGAEDFPVTLNLTNARVWSPEEPHLYAVTATLCNQNGKAVDDTVTTTGIRTVAQKDGQLLLNGKPALLIGAQIMGLRPYPNAEDAAKYNRSAPAESLMSEMLAIKNMGGNLLRVHAHMALNHTGGINDPRIAEMADQLGLTLFWSGPAWIREGDERSVDTAHVPEYIRQVYNHPSIINWELSNHPNTFKRDEAAQRTDAFVRRTVEAVLAVDTSRLITPTTFWAHTYYGNDAGTRDWKQRPMLAVPEYTHPLVTRGTQDAPTGYGAEWSVLRQWPQGLTADCLSNHTRAWFNFEHEESAAQPNWNLSSGWPWHHVRSYEAAYEKGSIGQVLGFEEWRASQAWQAFSAYESMRKQIFHGVAGFSWCTIEGGANSGTYEKPLLDTLGHAKLAWQIHKLLSQSVFAGSDDVDTVYGPGDSLTPCVFNLGPARRGALTITVKTPAGTITDRRTFPELQLAGGRSLLKLPTWRPHLPSKGFCVVEYAVQINR